MQKRLLFVDDEPIIRELYQTLGTVLGNGHEVSTASGGREALKLLMQKDFDVVVSDLAMPEMDGLEFLNEVVRNYPESARIVISGFADRMKVAECLTVGHRFFSKPFNFRSLATLLRRICEYSYLVRSERVRRIVCGTGALPTPPETYVRLNEMLNSPDSDIGDIGRIVEQDAGLSTKLLQIVNSAHFGVSHVVVTPTEAVQFVGLEVLKALMLGVQVFEYFDRKPFAKAIFGDLWNHSLKTAVGARKIALAEQAGSEFSEQCFLGGLLHDVGKLILAANAEREYQLVLDLAQNAKLPLDQAEHGIFASTHAHIGAYLLALWGIPDAVIRAVEMHHCLEQANLKEFSPVLAIHIAQNLDPDAQRLKYLDLETLARLGLEGRIPHWQELLTG